MCIFLILLEQSLFQITNSSRSVTSVMKSDDIVTRKLDLIVYIVDFNFYHFSCCIIIVDFGSLSQWGMFHEHHTSCVVSFIYFTDLTCDNMKQFYNSFYHTKSSSKTLYYLTLFCCGTKLILSSTHGRLTGAFVNEQMFPLEDTV